MILLIKMIIIDNMDDNHNDDSNDNIDNNTNNDWKDNIISTEFQKKGKPSMESTFKQLLNYR